MVTIPHPGTDIVKCSLLGGESLKFSKTNEMVTIEFGSQPINPVNNIVEMELNGNAMDILPMEAKPYSMTYNKPVNGSSNLKAHWSNHQWVDIKSVVNGDWAGDFWHPAEDDKQPWIEIDLGEKIKVSKAILFERGKNINSFELQYKSGDEWIRILEGKNIGEKSQVNLPETELQHLRMVITESSGTPGIYEIVLL